MKHLTPDDKRYILLRHEQGASLRGIGREIGRPDITIRRTLEAAGITFGPPKTSNRRSSPETEAHILSLYDAGLTWKEINAQAGVTSTTVAKVLERNGRQFDRKPESAEAKAEIIAALVKDGKSARAIGRMLGHSKSTICNIIADSGSETGRLVGCEYPDFFDEIDTPEKAYWLGFISADGCIVATPRHPEGSHLAVQLGIRDYEHLVKLKTALGAYTTVRKGIQRGDWGTRGSATLTVTPRRLIDSLLALGVTPRKSATLEPWNGPVDLMPHYWRGMIDGDGSLAFKGDGVYTVFLCGSEATVAAFKEWAAGICGTAAKLYTHSNCWYVSISGRYQVPKLVRAMYENAAVSLDRKQEIANAILAADGPRKKPGPASRFATEEEALANRRKVHREAQRRYAQKRRQQEAD
jgi:lambda repressor-like predicted transcriptional regulator